MAVIDVIVALIIGYGVRWYTEPEYTCEVVRYDVPARLQQDLIPDRCKEGIDPATGIYEECYVAIDPVYEMTPDQYNMVIQQMLDLQFNLFECWDANKNTSTTPIEK